jgi:hypothetical protein
LTSPIAVREEKREESLGVQEIALVPGLSTIVFIAVETEKYFKRRNA